VDLVASAVNRNRRRSDDSRTPPERTRLGGSWRRFSPVSRTIGGGQAAGGRDGNGFKMTVLRRAPFGKQFPPGRRQRYRQLEQHTRQYSRHPISVSKRFWNFPSPPTAIPRIRPGNGRRRQRRDEVGRQRHSRKHVLFPPEQRPRRAEFLRRPAKPNSAAISSVARWADRFVKNRTFWFAKYEETSDVRVHRDGAGGQQGPASHGGEHVEIRLLKELANLFISLQTRKCGF